MAYLLRVALALAVFCSPFAYASFPATQTNPEACTVAPCSGYKLSGWTPDRPVFSTVAAVCDDYSQAYMAKFPSETTTVKTVDLSTPKCVLRNVTYGYDMTGNVSIVSVTPTAPTYSCSSDAVLSGTTCTCTAPATQNATNDGCTVVDPMVQICKDNALIHNSTLGPDFFSTEQKYSDTPVVGGPGCASDGSPYPGRGCAVVFSATGAERLDADSPWRYTYLVRFTGGACSMDSGAADSLPPVPDPVVNECPAGTMPGTATMGGTSVTLCTKPIDVKTEPERQISKDNAGTPQETTTEKVSETTCLGANCKTTITTTTKDATGATVGVTVTVGEADKGTLCAKTPENKVCVTASGSWQGNCDSGFQGKGDPVLVAMAKEVHVQNCLLNKPTAESDLYGLESGKAGDRTVDLPGNETVNVGSGQFDASDAIGGASCISDRTVVVWGRSVVLPFSDVCPALDYLRNILLAISWFTAAGIVIGRKT